MLTPIVKPTPPRGKRSAMGAPSRTNTMHATASANFLWISTDSRFIARAASIILIREASSCAGRMLRVSTSTADEALAAPRGTAGRGLGGPALSGLRSKLDDIASPADGGVRVAAVALAAEAVSASPAPSAPSIAQ